MNAEFAAPACAEASPRRPTETAALSPEAVPATRPPRVGRYRNVAAKAAKP